MALSRHTSRIYMDEEDVDDVITLLDKRGDAEVETKELDAFRCGVYRGASLAFYLMKNHREIKEPSVFVAMVENMLSENTNQRRETK